MAGLVVKRWYFNPNAKANEPSILINARAPGFFAWILSIMKIDPTKTFSVIGERIIFEQTSLAGFIRTSTPASKVCSTITGYQRPWEIALAIWFSLSGAILSLGSVIDIKVLGIGLFIITAFTLGYYALNKNLKIGIQTSANNYSIVFKRSVIENQNINEEAAAAIAAYIDHIIQNANNSNKSYQNIGATPPSLQRVA